LGIIPDATLRRLRATATLTPPKFQNEDIGMSEEYSTKLAESCYRAMYAQCGPREEVHRATLEPFGADFVGCAPVLDLGCGTGMFLRILVANNLDCLGVDSSDECIEACRQASLPVVKGDALEFLRDAAESSYGGVFCSHIIEHLAPPQALGLFKGAYRALRNSGKLVVLTPNFRHLTVAAEGFWLDLTHVRPYPAPTMNALATMAGFRQTRCLTYRIKNGFIPYLGNAVRWLLTAGLHDRSGGLAIVCTK